MADVTNALAGRVVLQARDFGRLMLTPDEAVELRRFLEHAPKASVVVGKGRNKKVRPIASLVIDVLPDLAR